MINLKIVTPEGVTYANNNIEGITLPTTTGVITLKEDHMPLVSILEAGEVVIDMEKSEEVLLAVSTGIVQIRSESNVFILADTAERAEDIDLERAEEARKKAEDLMQEKENMADIDFALLEAKIQKELARLNVGKKYKKLNISTRNSQ